MAVGNTESDQSIDRTVLRIMRPPDGRVVTRTLDPAYEQRVRRLKRQLVTTERHTDAGASTYEPEGASWMVFAASLLGLAGIWNVVQGILAIGESRVVVVGEETFVFSNLNTWGWIVLLLGVAQLLAAIVFAAYGGARLKSD